MSNRFLPASFPRPHCRRQIVFLITNATKTKIDAKSNYCCKNAYMCTYTLLHINMGSVSPHNYGVGCKKKFNLPMHFWITLLQPGMMQWPHVSLIQACIMAAAGMYIQQWIARDCLLFSVWFSNPCHKYHPWCTKCIPRQHCKIGMRQTVCLGSNAMLNGPQRWDNP